MGLLPERLASSSVYKCPFGVTVGVHGLEILPTTSSFKSRESVISLSVPRPRPAFSFVFPSCLRSFFVDTHAPTLVSRATHSLSGHTPHTHTHTPPIPTPTTHTDTYTHIGVHTTHTNHTHLNLRPSLFDFWILRLVGSVSGSTRGQVGSLCKVH